MSTPTRETLAARLRELADFFLGDVELPEDADLVRQAADALAATCATCRHYQQDAHRMSGPCEMGVRFDLGGTVPHNFGCTLHETAHPGADTGTEREG